MNKPKFAPQNAKPKGSGGYGSASSSDDDLDTAQRSIEATFEGLLLKQEQNYFLTVQLQTTKVKQEGGLPPQQPFLTEKVRSDVCSHTKSPVFAKESFNLAFPADVELSSVQLVAELNKVENNGSNATRVGRTTLQLGGSKLKGSKKQILSAEQFLELKHHKRVRVQVQFHASVKAAVQGEGNEFQEGGEMIGEGTLLLLLSTYSDSHPAYQANKNIHQYKR